MLCTTPRSPSRPLSLSLKVSLAHSLTHTHIAFTHIFITSLAYKTFNLITLLARFRAAQKTLHQSLEWIEHNEVSNRYAVVHGHCPLL